MEDDKYFEGDYSFLKKIKYQIFKPNDSYSCCPDLMLNILTNNNKTPCDVIKYLYNYYNNDYFKNLLKFTENNKLLDLPIFLDNHDDKLCQIIYYFIESQSNYSICFSTKKINIDYKILYKIKLSKNQLIGILFQIDIQYNKIENHKYYEDLYNINKSEDDIYYFYYFEKKTVIIDNKIKLDNFNSIREITQIIFNKLSLEALELCRFDRLLTKQFKITFYNHQIYKRFLYSKIRTIDQIRFMLFSCSSLFSLGNTYCKDIDLLCYSDSETTPPQLASIIHTYFIEDRFELIDFHMKGYGGWTKTGPKAYLYDWFDKEWPALYYSKNMEETIFDPRFHYYFMGLKIISFKADFARRVKRNRATSYTDLIMLNYFNGIYIEPMQLERKVWINHEEKSYSNNELKELISKILKNIVRWHNIKMKAEKVYEYIKWPSDFKLSEIELNDIDLEIDKMIKKTYIKIYDIKPYKFMIKI